MNSLKQQVEELQRENRDLRSAASQHKLEVERLEHDRDELGKINEQMKKVNSILRAGKHLWKLSRKNVARSGLSLIYLQTLEW